MVGDGGDEGGRRRNGNTNESQQSRTGRKHQCGSNEADSHGEGRDTGDDRWRWGEGGLARKSNARWCSQQNNPGPAYSMRAVDGDGVSAWGAGVGRQGRTIKRSRGAVCYVEIDGHDNLDVCADG